MSEPANFWLYFPEKETAETAGKRLQGDGYNVEVRLGADDTNWLALGSKVVVSDEELDAAEVSLKALAAELGGEYDGYDRPVA